MAMFRLGLNHSFNNNYSFFDPATKINLTISNPVGFADRVTPYILRGLKYKTIIDVDNAIDLKTGKLKEVPQPQAPVNDDEIKTDVNIGEEVVGEVIEETEIPVEEDVTEVIEETVVEESQEVIQEEPIIDESTEAAIQANNVEEKKANIRRKK